MNTNKKIKFLDLNANYAETKEEIITRIENNVLTNTSFINGNSVKTFEDNFAKYIGVKFCIGVGNGTDALEIALQALDIKEGDEVITQANTFISTIFAIKSCGATPILVDCYEDNFMINCEELEKFITEKTKCIIPVHIYGHMANMDKVMSIAKKHDLFVVEDSAQAHGAMYKDRKAGSFGDIGCFSFYPGKNLGAWGDGGACVTNNDELALKIKKIHNLGSVQKYHHELLGRNSRLDSIQAEVLDVKLKYLDKNNQLRRECAKLYDQLLDNIDEVKLHKIDLDCNPVYHLYVIRCKNRDKLREYLLKKGIETRIHYPIPVHKSKSFSKLNHLNYENVDKDNDKLLSLPMYPEMSHENINIVVKHIRNFYTPFKIDIMTINYFDVIPEKFSGRYKLTDLFLKQIKYFKEIMKKENILISFTFIASNSDTSRSMFNSYFNCDEGDTYIEFPQKNKREYENIGDFWKMLNNKSLKGLESTFSKNCNISIFIGSNDFYSENIFTQIRNNYRSNVKQMFGLVSMNSNVNTSIMAFYPGMGSKSLKEYKYNGLQAYGLEYNPKNKHIFSGNIVVFNNFLFNDKSFRKSLNLITNAYSEYSLEFCARNCGAKLYHFNDVVHLNIKTGSDLNSFKHLRKHYFGRSLYYYISKNPNTQYTIDKTLETFVSEFNIS